MSYCFTEQRRKSAPTEAPTLLAEQINAPLETLQSIRTTIADTRETANGVLRVSASHSFGIKKLGPLIPSSRSAYPDIKLGLVLTDRIIDIVGDKVDVAIRHGPLPDSTLIAMPILHTRYYACASPAFLKKTPSVTKVQDITGL